MISLKKYLFTLKILSLSFKDIGSQETVLGKIYVEIFLDRFSDHINLFYIIIYDSFFKKCDENKM